MMARMKGHHIISFKIALSFPKIIIQKLLQPSSEEVKWKMVRKILKKLYLEYVTQSL